MQGSQFETNVNSGQINGDTSSAIKIIFNRQQATEGDYEGVLILEGEDQIIRVDLSAEVEIPPIIEYLFSDPKIVILRIQIVATELPQLRQKLVIIHS